MKQLIYENVESKQRHEKYAHELVEGLNIVLALFVKKHNYFGQPITEAFAYELVSDPIATFDDLLRKNAPFKPIGGKMLAIEKLAELCSIDRNTFILDFTVVLPGSVDQYNKQGRKGVLSLSEKDKPLIVWNNGKFALNEAQMQLNLEVFNVYAETPEQISLFEYWQGVCNQMNQHLEKNLIKTDDIITIADKLGLVACSKAVNVGQYKRWFGVNQKKLAEQIRSMAVN